MPENPILMVVVLIVVSYVVNYALAYVTQELRERGFLPSPRVAAASPSVAPSVLYAVRVVETPTLRPDPVADPSATGSGASAVPVAPKTAYLPCVPLPGFLVPFAGGLGRVVDVEVLVPSVERDWIAIVTVVREPQRAR